MVADPGMKRQNTPMKGFTLIELMIVVVIIAVLAAIAYPLYMSQVHQARRVDAKAALKTAINRGEQFYSQAHHYPNKLSQIDMNTTTDNGTYKLSIAKSSKTKFKVVAKPQGAQAGDECGKLTLRANGETAAEGDSDCW